MQRCRTDACGCECEFRCRAVLLLGPLWSLRRGRSFSFLTSGNQWDFSLLSSSSLGQQDLLYLHLYLHLTLNRVTLDPSTAKNKVYEGRQ
ncbi:unnamed protein product [Merluccius merluccius]